MRAIQIQRFGGPEVLELAELPRPETGPGGPIPGYAFSVTRYSR